MQAYNKQDGKLYVKIMIPTEHANNNSNSIDKHTDEDDLQHPAMIDD